MAKTNNNHKAEVTREQRRKKQKSEKIRIRLIPIWLRVIIVVILIIISACLGAAFGYGVLGGGNPLDVFKIETWQHIIDLIDRD
ncbi:DNA-directed RNA polymerase subunit beta [Bacillaceae bacterium Marseille-Q3522]|nr:DNA-directed RNA polymerase subunit beta [Bacillaceae bacterium Marseille-Q3522]